MFLKKIKTKLKLYFFSDMSKWMSEFNSEVNFGQK